MHLYIYLIADKLKSTFVLGLKWNRSENWKYFRKNCLSTGTKQGNKVGRGEKHRRRHPFIKNMAEKKMVQEDHPTSFAHVIDTMKYAMR